MITVNAIGRLGQDAAVRDAGQSKVCSFTMAVNTGKKDGQGKDTSEWYSVDIWGKRGEALCQYLLKGNQVAVFGRLELQRYKNQSGLDVTKPVISVSEIELLQKAPANNNGQQAAPQQQRQATPPVQQQVPAVDPWQAVFASEDEIPF